MGDPEFHGRIKIEFDDMERNGSSDLDYYKDRSARTYFIAKENRARKAMSPPLQIVWYWMGCKVC